MQVFGRVCVVCTAASIAHNSNRPNFIPRLSGESEKINIPRLKKIDRKRRNLGRNFFYKKKLSWRNWCYWPKICFLFPFLSVEEKAKSFWDHALQQQQPQSPSNSCPRGGFSSQTCKISNRVNAAAASVVAGGANSNIEQNHFSGEDDKG